MVLVMTGTAPATQPTLIHNDAECLLGSSTINITSIRKVKIIEMMLMLESSTMNITSIRKYEIIGSF